MTGALFRATIPLARCFGFVTYRGMLKSREKHTTDRADQHKAYQHTFIDD